MKTIVVAQVGCGYWGPNVLRSFRAAPGARVKWLCDQKPGRLEWARGEFPGLKTTADLDDVLNDPEVDAVAVATEPVSHYALGRAVLSAGKHLFMEKPLATTGGGAADLARRAKARGLSVGVGHVYLYNPAIRALRAELKSGRLGAPLYFDLARVNPGPPEPRHSVIWDLAPHEASLALSFAGAPAKTVRATGLRWTRGVLEAAFLEVAFSNGVFARIHASWMANRRVRTLDAYCAKGAAFFNEMDKDAPLRIEYPGKDTRVGAKKGFAGTLTYGAPRVVAPKLPKVQPLAAECADFVACARRGKDPESGPSLGVAVARVLEAAETSALRGGKEITL